VYNWVTHKSAPEAGGNHRPSYWVEDRAGNDADSIPYQIMTYQPQRQYFQVGRVCVCRLEEANRSLRGQLERKSDVIEHLQSEVQQLVDRINSMETQHFVELGTSHCHVIRRKTRRGRKS